MAATRTVDRSLHPEALHEIERSLHGKLKALGLSESFIDRSLEDALQKGLVEYLRALERGEAVENRNGFVVHAAFRRAVDELRREAKQADGAVIEAIIDSGGVAEPAADEVAIEHLQARELRQAVGTLSPEEQQVLSLHYFEELTAEASAKALFCSERTYRRRLKQALRKLGRVLGAPVPEPGSELAIEIGVVTFVVLGGATVPISQGPLESVARFAEGLIGRTAGSDTSERVLTIAGSGPGKVVGGCVAVAATCLLAVGGAELVGVGAGESPDQGQPANLEREPPREQSAVVVAPPVPRPPTPSSSRQQAAAGTGSQTSSSASTTKRRERQANQQVESQGVGSLLPDESPGAESAPVQSTSAPVESTPSDSVGSQAEAGLLP